MTNYSVDVTFHSPKPGESSGHWNGNLLGLIKLIVKYSNRATFIIRGASKTVCGGTIRGYKFSDWPAPVTLCQKHFKEISRESYIVKGELPTPTQKPSKEQGNV